MNVAIPAEALQAARTDTMYFVGVSTGSSAIHRVFAAWKPILGIPTAELRGIDLPLDASTEQYRRIASFLVADPLSRGALVTTHKLLLFNACRDLFCELDDSARLLHEVSCLVAEPNCLNGYALDTVTSRFALEAITEVAGRPVLLLGAGGAALALAMHLASLPRREAPSRVVVTDIRSTNLAEMARIVALSGSPTNWEYRLVNSNKFQDDMLVDIGQGSLIVNATGLGKDRPGSPVSDSAEFPRGAIIWDFNYRGSLEFLAQSKRMVAQRGLDVHDGWLYFVHGWTRAIAEVFALDIPSSGPAFDALAVAAKAIR